MCAPLHYVASLPPAARAGEKIVARALIPFATHRWPSRTHPGSPSLLFRDKIFTTDFMPHGNGRVVRIFPFQRYGVGVIEKKEGTWFSLVGLREGVNHTSIDQFYQPSHPLC
ncbi:hypothetical protein Bpfe_021778 [Biomphalaria pfeifferi]|uniref:Uncharacterized protein n=1 Tax=Biomphalaria pfeifferi TaxID=112525 RepID=A0AAD8F2G4_BIOPF|nr:hypothetical protein Bpfe_021778 [Biomphalaria pfeifferi]